MSGLQEDSLELINRIFHIDSRLTGRAYLRVLVKQMAEVLELAYAFVALPDETFTRVATLEMWAKGGWGGPLEYGLGATPCEHVFAGTRTCIHPGGVAEAFPEDLMLAEEGIEAYIGTPILGGERHMLGLLVGLDTRERQEAKQLEAIFEVISGRVAAELERQRWEEQQATLQQELEARVEARTQELREAQDRLVALARQAGMADIASNVLHNVGNLLTSAQAAMDGLKLLGASRTSDMLARTSDLVKAQGPELSAFLTEDPRGQRVPELLSELSSAVKQEQGDLQREVQTLNEVLGLIKRVIATQQSHVGAEKNWSEEGDLRGLAQDALSLMEASLTRHQVRATITGPDEVPVVLDRLKTLQIVNNLVHNAVSILDEQPQEARQIELRLGVDEGEAWLQVADSGPGVEEDRCDQIFRLGYTTREDGHGIGLHSSAIFAREMNGSLELTPQDEALGGACFTLKLPRQQA